MSHKINKILAILIGSLGSLLLILVAVLLLNGGKLSEMFDVSDLFNRGTAETPVRESDPAETQPVSTDSVIQTDPSTEAPTQEPVLATVLRVGVSDLKGNFNPFADLCEGDATVMQLVGINLLTRDRTGQVIKKATEGEYAYFQGDRHLYTGAADFTMEYDEKADETSVTVKLKDGIYFSDGVKLTVDDLIFNLYVRLQPNYNGSGDLRSCDIVGLKNYYYNNSLAESIQVEEEEIAQAIENPTDAVADFIRSIIRETLLAEAEESKNIWMNYVTLNYGNSAEEFFYRLYGQDLNYNPVGKTMEQVCEDVIESYGLDYKNLASHYAVDENYFNERVETYTREILLYEKMKEAGGEPVDYISGIVRLGDYAVKIHMHGNTADASYDIFDMIVAPMHHYGDPYEYNYETHHFGFKKGEYEIPERALNAPMGAGPYVFSRMEGDTVYLVKNDAYYKSTSDIDYMTIRPYGDNVLEEISQDMLDVVVLDGSRSVCEAIYNTNSNGSLSGDKLHAEEINDLGYSYIGINADLVKVGEDPYSAESIALRKGILTAIAAFRDSGYAEYYGDSAHILEYPVSPFFGLTPEGKEFSRAYAEDGNGRILYKEGKKTSNPEELRKEDEKRYDACLAAVKDYLIEAGYTYNENTEKFTAAPEGAAMRYEVLLCGKQYENHPSYATLAYANSLLYKLGISLDIHYVNSIENMLVHLYLGEASLWDASWNCIGGPNFDLHYHSGEGSNLFRLKDELLDQWIEEYGRLSNSEEQEQALAKAQDIMRRVRELAVELPCYNQVDYLICNVKTIDVSTLPTRHSRFWTWMDDVAFWDVFPTIQKAE